MRAFDKLKSLVGASVGQDASDSKDVSGLPDIDTLIATAAPIAKGSEMPVDVPKLRAKKSEPLIPPSLVKPAAENASPAPDSDMDDKFVLLQTVIPAGGPVIKPAQIKPATIPATQITPTAKRPPPVAETKPAPVTPQTESPSPMTNDNPASMPAPKPSDKLTVDLDALDKLITVTPAPTSAGAAPSRELGPRRKTAGLTHMRNDLAQLNKDMSSGEQFYAQSLRRINDLIEYAYETETTLSALEKLEPENARLKTDLTEATQKLTDQVVRAESMKSKADAYETRYLETRQALEKAQLSLTQMEALRETLSREIEAKDNDLAIMINKAREIKNAHNLDVKALDDYKAKASELANELSVTLSGRHETEQRLQDMSARYESLQTERSALERMVTQTRNAQRATEEHNLALKTQLETVLSDVKIFKQQFDAAAQNKEAEIGLLRGKLADMSSDLAVKDGVVHRAHEEMADLRDKFDTAHRGRRKLLEHIEGQKAETDHLKSELEKIRAEHSRLTSDYVTSQNDIESLHRVNEAQSDKLKRYTALNRKPVVTPAAFTVAPNPFPPASMPVETFETPVFATSDTPPPHPDTLDEVIDSIETRQTAAPADASSPEILPVAPMTDITPEPLSGAVSLDETAAELSDVDTAPETVSYPDINFDFEPETDRRAPDSPMRNTGSGSDFERDFAELAAMAPIRTDAPVSQDASEALKSDAEKIEKALLEFHDLDLLAESAG